MHLMDDGNLRAADAESIAEELGARLGISKEDLRVTILDQLPTVPMLREQRAQLRGEIFFAPNE